MSKAIIPEAIKNFLMQKLQRSEKRIINQMHDFRKEVMSDAINFIKRKLNTTTKLITKYHHDIIGQYDAFK